MPVPAALRGRFLLWMVFAPLAHFESDYHEAHPCLRIKSTDGKQESIALTKASSDTAIYALMDYFERQGKIEELTAVGHRVVHGADRIHPIWINHETMEEMQRLVPLAPLHQPHNLSPIMHIRRKYPHLPQVACFDTSFHRTLPWLAETYALPQELRGKGVKRYGFHGLSYEYIALKLPELFPPEQRERVIAVHLGSGCSACALKDGKSIATTMGFTALDGLMMRTRCGALDPGAVLYLIREQGYTPEKLERLLYEESGLKGLTGGSGDTRDILASVKTDEHAWQALELFCYMAAREIAGLIAVLGGMQALIFTGEIGVHEVEIRAGIAKYFNWLKINILVQPTDEALMIARHTLDMWNRRKRAGHGHAPRAA